MTDAAHAAYIRKKGAHRRRDLERLKEHAAALPLVVTDEGDKYAVWTAADQVGKIPLVAGRYEVVWSYMRGWRDCVDANGGNLL